MRSLDKAPTAPLEAGILLIGRDLQSRGRTPTVQAWLRALNPGGLPYKDGIPSLVWTTIGRLLASEQGEDPERPARIRVRTGDGTWAIVEAARLDDPDGTVAISLHGASMEDILAVTCQAFGLSRRERELAALVVQGLDTHAIARQLNISMYTVQDHLKSIFDKIGVHGRLELVTRLLAQAA